MKKVRLNISMVPPMHPPIIVNMKINLLIIIQNLNYTFNK